MKKKLKREMRKSKGTEIVKLLLIKQKKHYFVRPPIKTKDFDKLAVEKPDYADFFHNLKLFLFCVRERTQ